MSLYDPDVAVGTRLERALTLVGRERMRQDHLKAEGRFKHTPADSELTSYELFAILSEEVGEVAKEVLTQSEGTLAHDTTGTREALRKELIQVAAVAVAWIEGLGG